MYIDFTPTLKIITCTYKVIFKYLLYIFKVLILIITNRYLVVTIHKNQKISHININILHNCSYCIIYYKNNSSWNYVIK